MIGSRDEMRVRESAEQIADRAGVKVAGANAVATAGADLVLLAVPWVGHRELASSLSDQLAGKVVISCVNPLGFDEHGPFGLSLEEPRAGRPRTN